MPTPSEEKQNRECGVRSGVDAPFEIPNLKFEIGTRRQSVFGNYAPRNDAGAPTNGDVSDARQSHPPLTAPSIVNRQSSIDYALARSFLYRFLAKAYEYPAPEGWTWLSQAEIQSAVRSAIDLVLDASAISPDEEHGHSDPALENRKFNSVPGDVARSSAPKALAISGADLQRCLTSDQFESFASEYVAAFSHAARGSCPLNEIEYGDLKADPLFQPHRLADLTAFYQAFGLEITEDAGERQDHICLELEFMSVLAAKEAFALQDQIDPDDFELCRRTQKEFLREHLGRWTPAFSRRIGRAVEPGALRALSEFVREFVITDCRALGVSPGSEDLMLRPVDESGEGLCSSCGLKNLPPGVT